MVSLLLLAQRYGGGRMACGRPTHSVACATQALAVDDTHRSGATRTRMPGPALRMVNEDVELLSRDPIQGH